MYVVFWCSVDAPNDLASEYSPPVSIERYLTGEGQQFGGVSVNLRNDHPTETLKILYFDTYPCVTR